MKPGTFLWAMEQLIAGKKVARQNWDDKTFYYYNDDGVVIFNDSREEPGRANPPKGLANEDDWIIWTPPVNYIPGTFPWAWEQLKAGKTIKRKDTKESRYYTIKSLRNNSFITYSYGGGYMCRAINVAEINATDWEVVE